jgi:hypothetical protein
VTSDQLHQPDKHPEWNESYYFNLYDKDKDVCAFMRIGLKPNRKQKDVFCFFLLPDGTVAGIRDDVPMLDAKLEVKGLNFECLEDERVWNLTYKGNMPSFTGRKARQSYVEFSFKFEGINKMFDYRECVRGTQSEMTAEAVTSEHVEQFGRLRGRLSTGITELDINALGERDHSWGIRDWNAPKLWIWMTAQFGEDCAFNLTKLVMDSGEIDAGFVYLDGRNRAIGKASVQTDYFATGGPKGFRVTLFERWGAWHAASGNTARTAELPFATGDGRAVSVMYENLVKFSFKGRPGYGIAEYLIRKT